MTDSPILKIAINVPLSRQFDYLPPATGPLPAPGTRVHVPFGRQRKIGLVLDHAESSSFAGDKIRRAADSIDKSPLLNSEDLWLIRFTSDYYHHPIGEVVAAALPAMLRAEAGEELARALADSRVHFVHGGLRAHLDRTTASYDAIWLGQADPVDSETAQVVTVEGIAEGDRLHPLQQTFLEGAALQCGICTPGFLVAAKSLLDANPDPTETEIRYALAGNLCRCTGYDKIIRSVQEAAVQLREATR